ncbi:MAG TPA: biotin carboxylase N-terminal domain-containing protein, partial [Anaerolineae bacterium]
DRCSELKAERGYLDKKAILETARAAGVDAIHAGYGFLAERPDFAEACAEAGIVFVGPPPEFLARMQCKTDALALARGAGFATPEFTARAYGPDELPELEAEAARLGYPLVIKSCVGGRGRGSRLVRSADAFGEAVRWAQAQTQAVYGDNLVYLEKAIMPAHNLAVQVLGDNFSNLVHLGDRDGSVQRGNQKLITESPSPALTPDRRAQLWEAALALARLFQCHSAASVEFLVDEAGNFYFCEIKPRIQTDHPVTEMVSGVDIVQEQIRLAAGEPLGYGQDAIRLHGCALQAVIAAEDPWDDFLPGPGRLREVRLPGGPNVRVDTYVYGGCDVPAAYDPIIAKLVVWAEDRPGCVRRLARALQDFTIVGVPTTLPHLQRIVQEPAFVEGTYTTALLEQPLAPLEPEDETYLRDLAVAAAIAFARRNLMSEPSTPERVGSGWHRSSRRLPE